MSRKCMPAEKKKKKKTLWDDYKMESFIDLCIEEMKVGNQSGTNFYTRGWKNIIGKLNENLDLDCDHKILRNKLDGLKKDWVAWYKLIGKETGLGWDPKKKTISASNEWWEKKLQEIPDAKKFRNRGLVLAPKLDLLFGGTTATWERAWAPSSGVLPKGLIGTSQVPMGFETDGLVEGIGDSSAEDTATESTQSHFSTTPTVIPTIPGTQDKGKKRSSDMPSIGRRKRLGVAERLTSQMERIFNVVESNVTIHSNMEVNSKPCNSSEVCVAALHAIPEIERGSELFMIALDLFVKKEYRDLFMAIKDHDLQAAWLRRHMK